MRFSGAAQSSLSVGLCQLPKRSSLRFGRRRATIEAKRTLKGSSSSLVAEANLMRSRIAWTIVASGTVLIAFGLTRLSLTALQEPGLFETRIANLLKRFVIHMASRHGIPRPPADTQATVEAGATHYGLDCGICHGVDGRALTPPGQWMYPRAANLTSKRVQSYSDQELFWIN